MPRGSTPAIARALRAGRASLRLDILAHLAARRDAGTSAPRPAKAKPATAPTNPLDKLRGLRASDYRS